MKDSFLVLDGVSKAFGKTVVIDDLSLAIEKGTMTTLLGPSGCGKTTILRLVAGLETPTAGRILIDGEDVTQTAIQHRDICIVFQSYALFPHMSIADNVGYGLKMLKVSKSERAQRIEEALALVDLAGFGSRYVDQISGGQQQRVALARALVLKPKVLLFDEPLSNLDANLRRSMREKIRDIQQTLNITSLYVTHDQSEAFAVSDQVVVMDKGKIVQKGTAKSLYLAPNSRFMANFMGEATLFDGVLSGNSVTFNRYEVALNNVPAQLADGACTVGVRPEAVRLTTTGQSAQQCQVESALFMGNHWEVVVRWQGETFLINLAPDAYIPDAESLYISIASSGVFVLPKAA